MLCLLILKALSPPFSFLLNVRARAWFLQHTVSRRLFLTLCNHILTLYLFYPYHRTSYLVRQNFSSRRHLASRCHCKFNAHKHIFSLSSHPVSFCVPIDSSPGEHGVFLPPLPFTLQTLKVQIPAQLLINCNLTISRVVT